MSRLYGIKVDENRWDVKELDNSNYHTYKLFDKLTNNVYFFDHIIGAEEVKPGEFLVFDRYCYDDFRIRRVLAENSKLKVLFQKEFSRFEFITKDRILFTYYDKKGNYRFSGVYSIENNDLLDDGIWLDGLSVEVFKCKKKPDDKELFIEDEIISLPFNNPKLIYTVDPYTLQPNSDLYSKINNTMIPVNTKEDIINYKMELKKSIYELEKQALDERNNKLNDIKKLIKAKKES